MAVEQNRRIGGDESQQRKAGGELVDDKGAGLESFQFAGERDLDEELEMAQDGADNGEAVEDGHGDGPFPVDADIEGAWGIN